MSKPTETVIIEILDAFETIAKREFSEMQRIPWMFFWKKGDAIARAKAWNEAWALVLEKAYEFELETEESKK